MVTLPWVLHEHASLLQLYASTQGDGAGAVIAWKAPHSHILGGGNLYVFLTMYTILILKVSRVMD
jgi:hypothetical protein